MDVNHLDPNHLTIVYETWEDPLAMLLRNDETPHKLH